MKIALLVQGLFEKSDSIGYDCVYEYEYFSSRFNSSHDDIRIFAERFEKKYYPDIPIESLKSFYVWCKKNQDGIVIYHYCGSWKVIDEFLIERTQKSIIRWHNNTPPWFYFSKYDNLTHTLEGFNNIVSLTQSEHLVFWVNSKFTQKQLIALGGKLSQVSVVFPASCYLERASANVVRRSHFAAATTINLLFVGRVVGHKGHKSIVAVAERLHKLTGRDIIVRFAGREDAIKKDIELFGHGIDGITVEFCGEVSEQYLRKLYDISDVFVCLSEHEGFGLPVFEAMRCGLPIVVWSITSLNDFMREHPLAFPYYDLNIFASAIASLQYDKIYNMVMDAQESILEKYNKEIVNEQLDISLSNFLDEGAKDYSDNFPYYLNKSNYLRKIINYNINYIKENFDNPPLRNHDSNPNLFSRYDKTIFQLLFKHMERLRFSQFENFENKGVFVIQGKKFLHRCGTVAGEDLFFAFNHYTSSHLIFGPYYKLPAGKYIVEFDIYISRCSLSSFYIDVSTQKNGVLKKDKVSINRLPYSYPKLYFDVKDDTDSVEFRVRFKKDFTGEIIFKGVKLRRR